MEPSDPHQEDLTFLDQLKTATKFELSVLLRFQACEAWRRVAVQREIKRRILESSKGRTWVSEAHNVGSIPTSRTTEEA